MLRAQDRNASRMRVLVACAAVSCALGCAAGAAVAAEPEGVWRKLVAPSSLVCDEKPFRATVEEFASRNGVPVWIDRRLDPNRPLSLSVSGSVFEILDQIARNAGGELACEGQVVILGLPERAGRMAGMIDLQRRRLHSRRGTSPLLHPRLFGWQALSTPSEARLAVEQAWGVPLEGDRLPHDLWPAAQYETLDYVAACALVLGGFDLAVDLSHQSPRAVSLAAVPERYEREYRGARLSQAAEDELRRVDEAAVIETGATGPRVTATALGHQAIELSRARAAHGSRVTRAQPREEARFDLVVQNKPAGSVLQALAAQLGVELVIEESATTTAEKVVSINVQQKTLREISEIVCAAAGLTCQFGQGELRVGI